MALLIKSNISFVRGNVNFREVRLRRGVIVIEELNYTATKKSRFISAISMFFTKFETELFGNFSFQFLVFVFDTSFL